LAVGRKVVISSVDPLFRNEIRLFRMKDACGFWREKAVGCAKSWLLAGAVE
jgi:hypothetical protein